MTTLKAKTIRGALAILALAALSACVLPAQELIVTAPGKMQRTQEILELPLAEVREHIPGIEHKIAANAATHEPLITQIYSSPDVSEHDMLLIAVQMPAHRKLTIAFVDKGSTPQESQVFGREAPERKDDFAWENKYVTYRVYGPALEATGEITSGIDVWSKRVPNFVIDSFYKHDAEGQRTHNPKLSYHVDDGVGLDSYLVGPSRGCGGTGILSSGKLWVSKNYTHLKMLSNGPVRFAFELTYAPWNADGVEVTETKRIVLDAGTHLNRITSTFTYAGSAALNAAVGLPIRAGGIFHSLDGRILSVWSIPQNPTAGHIATGVIASPTQAASITQLDDQALMVYSVHSGESFTYFAGSGWSKADMPTQRDWENYLSQVAYERAHPLKVAWQESMPGKAVRASIRAALP